MTKDVHSLVIDLTPSAPFTDTLHKGTLTRISRLLRQDSDNCSVFYEVLRKRAGSKSSQVRFLCLELTHFVFCRSAHFRQVFCYSYFEPFVALFVRDLPPPEQFQTRIRTILPYIVSQWRNRFGEIYPQLAILERVFGGVVEKASLNLRVDIDRVKRMYQPVVEEMETLIELLVPSPDRFEFFEPSDEYRNIVLDSMRDKRRVLSKCLEDVDQLRISASVHGVDSELVLEVSAFAVRVGSVESRTIAVGIDGDEFVDVDDYSE